MQKNKNTMTPAAQEARQPDGSFTMRMGNTTFIVGLYCKQDGKESLEDKIKKLIRDDVKTGNF